MAEARVYPERPLIQMFLAGYEQGVWKDATLNSVEETQENAVEVIATRSDGKTLALEHTLIELFVGEKYDSTSLPGRSSHESRRTRNSSSPAAL